MIKLSFGSLTKVLCRNLTKINGGNGGDIQKNAGNDFAYRKLTDFWSKIRLVNFKRLYLGQIST